MDDTSLPKERCDYVSFSTRSSLKQLCSMSCVLTVITALVKDFEYVRAR